VRAGGQAVRRSAGQAVSRSVGHRAGVFRSLGGAVCLGCSLCFAVLGFANDLVAQSQPADRPTARPPDRLTVYLMTMGPGKRVWERFGHNAIWIHDPVAGTDQTYNYGLFDLRQENFLLRFVQGRMWYWMRGFPAQSYVESYRRDNRSVWVQELEMAPEAKRELQRFLEWNERPENRYYHYDYYRDNCSTRVRDALDRVLGGQVRSQMAEAPAGTTYRFHTQRLTANDPLVFTGLLLALGQPADRPITKWEEMFLPLSMREHFRNLTVRLPDGRQAPLVKSERTLFESTAPLPPDRPPNWTAAYFLIGLAIGGLVFALALAARRNQWARYGFLTVTWIWLLISGIAGLVLAGLWGLTDHAAAYRNENVLQADLLALALLWYVTRLAFDSSKARSPPILLAGIIAGLSLLGGLLQLLPAFQQVNAPIIALALPAHCGVLAAARSLARG